MRETWRNQNLRDATTNKMYGFEACCADILKQSFRYLTNNGLMDNIGLTTMYDARDDIFYYSLKSARGIN